MLQLASRVCRCLSIAYTAANNIEYFGTVIVAYLWLMLLRNWGKHKKKYYLRCILLHFFAHNTSCAAKVINFVVAM